MAHNNNSLKIVIVVELICGKTTKIHLWTGLKWTNMALKSSPIQSSTLHKNLNVHLDFFFFSYSLNS